MGHPAAAAAHPLMSWATWIWVPAVTAFIGWVTNWIAIRMLFWPRRSVGVGRLRWQGLIPRRQAEIAARTAEVVERELLSQHVIRAEIHRLDLPGYLDVYARRLVARLGVRLQRIPLLGRLINEGMLGRLEVLVRDTLLEEVAPMRDKLAEDLERNLQVRQLVEARMAALDLDRLEGIVWRVARKEFRAIEWLGGVLGLIIGLAQVLILWFTQT